MVPDADLDIDLDLTPVLTSMLALILVSTSMPALFWTWIGIRIEAGHACRDGYRIITGAKSSRHSEGFLMLWHDDEYCQFGIPRFAQGVLVAPDGDLACLDR